MVGSLTQKGHERTCTRFLQGGLSVVVALLFFFLAWLPAGTGRKQAVLHRGGVLGGWILGARVCTSIAGAGCSGWLRTMCPPGGWETRVDNKQKPGQCWMLLIPARVSAAAVKPEDIS